MRLFICIAILLSCYCFGRTQTITNWSHRIVSKERRTLSNWLNPCGNVINELSIDGKTFDHVRGVSKYYIQVPNTNIIVFVVEDSKYSVTYHVFNMDTEKDIIIPADYSDFGQSVGSKNLRDSIEVADDGKIVLCHYDVGAKSTLPSLSKLDSVKSFYYLDLNKRAVVARKTLYYDKESKLINESHWPSTTSVK